MEFIRLQCKNKILGTSELVDHHELIDERIEAGYKYLGAIPVEFGPSGKVLAIELLFDVPEYLQM